MWWGIENHDGEWVVEESYDCGKSWICNDVFSTVELAMDFVDFWIARESL
jgi:hypothetical protein